MDTLAPQTLDRFKEVLEHNRQHNQWRGIILTGSEITLRNDLLMLVKQAKAANFDHVRIQTHGMHLANSSFCDRLLDAGVDEFFVSVAGSDEKTHDEITTVAGSFEKMLRGMEYLDTFEHVSLITNTVVTRLSYQLLPDLVDAFSHLHRLVQMEFWNYFPMQERDHKNLIVRHTDIQPYLISAIGKAKAQGRNVEVKNYPQCLMAEHADVLINDQPELLIDPEFWRQFERNGFYQCLQADHCSSEECLGLNQANTAKFGWEEKLLTPV